MKRIERLRLYPTPRQRARLHMMLDVTRELWNAALQERRDAYRFRGQRVSGKQQYRELTALRGAGRLDERLASVYRECEDAVIHRLDVAFAAYFRRIKAGERPGYPRFKPAARWKQIEFPHGDRALKFNPRQSRLTIPGVGQMRVRRGRSIPAFGRAWLIERNGRWHACFECERAPVYGPVDLRKIVGVDRGVRVLAALSDGVLIEIPREGRRRRNSVRNLQRALDAATKKDERGRCLNRRDPKRIAAAQRLARREERAANARRDHAHKVARRIVHSAGVIALESLSLQNMTRCARGTIANPGINVAAKAALNRAILGAGFGLLEQLLISKAEEAGKRVVRVPARFSSQQCSRCGHVAVENRRRRRFACVGCGYEAHADVNAALVIRWRAQSALLSTPDTGADPATLLEWA